MSHPYELRKTFVAVEEILTEQGRSSGPPLVKAAAAAVIRNPVAKRFGDDLAELMAWGKPLAVMTTRGRMNARLGGLKAAEVKGDGLR